MTRPRSLALLSLLALPVSAQSPGEVVGFQAINSDEGGLPGPLAAPGDFGSAAARLGDLNGDGVVDVAVGAADHDGFRGAVWILFLEADGTVGASTLLASGANGLPALPDMAFFGESVARLGDLDGDGVVELAVGAPGVLDDAGLVWILFLHPDGSVKSTSAVGPFSGGFTGHLEASDQFGTSVESLGDWSGDGIPDLAVGAVGDDDGGHDFGAVWLLALDVDGTVKAHTKISQTAGGFAGDLSDATYFGSGIANLGDFDGDGVADLAVGASAVWPILAHSGKAFVLFLEPGGTVKSHVRIESGQPELPDIFSTLSVFGEDLENVGDLDGDGLPELAVGDPNGGDGGVVWVLFLHPDGSLRRSLRLDVHEGCPLGCPVGEPAGGLPIAKFDQFGSSLAALGDLDGDGRPEVLVGSRGFASGENFFFDPGGVYVLSLEAVIAAQVQPLGCGVNPPDSLSVTAGELSEGAGLTLALHNPLATQSHGALPVLLVAAQPSVAHPCGLTLPGWGMAGAGAPGELLISHLPPTPVVPPIVGPAWVGAPVEIALPGPAPGSGLAGLEFYVQGLLWDPTAPGGVEFGLTDALALTVGSSVP